MNNVHHNTHTHIYIYICVCMCILKTKYRFKFKTFYLPSFHLSDNKLMKQNDECICHVGVMFSVRGTRDINKLKWTPISTVITVLVLACYALVHDQLVFLLQYRRSTLRVHHWYYLYIESELTCY